MRIDTIRKLRRILFLPYSIFFNFYYLPFKQAIKLPILFYVRPTFLKLSGKVIIENRVKRNMIRLGIVIAPIDSPSIFRWANLGTVIFKGECVISHHTFIACGKDSIIEFGGKSSFSSGLRIMANNKISFGEKARIGWDCSFIDTDFHSIIDLSSNKEIPQSAPISIGYAGWIGHNSIVSKGTKIPDHSIVASGSVVKGYFKKSNTIIGGNPAVVMDDGYKRDDV